MDSEVFINTQLKPSIVSKTQGRIEFISDDENRWRVPFPYPEVDPEVDVSGETDFSVEACSTASQTGLTVTYKGKLSCSCYYSELIQPNFRTYVYSVV